MKEFMDRLAEIEAEKATVLADMEQEKARKKQEVIQMFRDVIAENDLDLDEIVDALKPPKPQKAEKPRRTRTVTVYALIADPALRYSSGRVPTWMKDMMSASGLDSGSAEDRNIFKSRHMQMVF